MPQAGRSRPGGIDGDGHCGNFDLRRRAQRLAAGLDDRDSLLELRRGYVGERAGAAHLPQRFLETIERG